MSQFAFTSKELEDKFNTMVSEQQMFGIRYHVRAAGMHETTKLLSGQTLIDKEEYWEKVRDANGIEESIVNEPKFKEYFDGWNVTRLTIEVYNVSTAQEFKEDVFVW